MRFIKGKYENLISYLCCLDFQTFPHGFELLEGNTHDQNEPCNNEFTMSWVNGMPLILISTLNLMPPWGT
jgi:hypothetical protein